MIADLFFFYSKEQQNELNGPDPELSQLTLQWSAFKNFALKQFTVQ